MIYGIDHVARSTTDLDRAIGVAEQQGYTVRFVERALPNPREKEPYLSVWTPTHEIAYLERDGEIPLELTNHGSLSSGASYGWNREGSVLAVPTSDPEASRAWWQYAFRCSPDPMRLEALGRRATFIFNETPRPKRLDTAGHPCVALLSTTIYLDRERAMEDARSASDVFSLTVNGQDLRLCILEGPGGELLELVEVDR